MSVSVLLWDLRDGALAWEASGGGMTQEGEYTCGRASGEVVAATAARMAEQLPLAREGEALEAGGG